MNYRHISIVVAAAFGLGIGAVAFRPSVSSAQSAPPADQSQRIVDFSVDRADIREAIKSLFKTIGASYTISPDVQGVVTMSVHHVTLDSALQGVLREVNATYRIEGGVYQIILANPEARSGLLSTTLLDFHVENANIRDVLRAVFKNVGLSYSIHPDVQGVVTVSMRNARLETILPTILRQTNATYVVEGGVYEIIPKTEEAAASAHSGGVAPDQGVPQGIRFGSDSGVARLAPSAPGGDSGSTAITTDNRFVYVVSGGWVYKLEKGSLKEVARHSLGGR